MKLLSAFALVTLLVNSATALDPDTVKEVVGAWRMEFRTPEGDERTPIIVVGKQRDELVAWYVVDEERETFTDVRITDEAMHLTIKPKEFSGNLTAKLKLRLKESNVCSGTIEFEEANGDSGKMECTGKRFDNSEFDEVVAWKVDFITPEGDDRTANIAAITVGNRQYGWYSSDEYELPATKFSKQGNRIVAEFRAALDDDQQIKITFEGTTSKDSIEGEAKWQIGGESGSFPFDGKKAP